MAVPVCSSHRISCMLIGRNSFYFIYFFGFASKSRFAITTDNRFVSTDTTYDLSRYAISAWCLYVCVRVWVIDRREIIIIRTYSESRDSMYYLCKCCRRDAWYAVVSIEATISQFPMSQSVTVAVAVTCGMFDHVPLHLFAIGSANEKGNSSANASTHTQERIW